MAFYRIPYLRPQDVHRIRFGEDRMIQSAGSEAAFCGFFDDKNDLVHADCAESRIETPETPNLIRKPGTQLGNQRMLNHCLMRVREN